MSKEILTEFEKVQKALKPLKKDGNNPYFNSKYITLDGIIAAIKDAITDSKADLGYYQEIVDGIVHTKIYSTKSDDLLDILGVPVDTVNKNSQQVGSALTYARRYSLATAFAISADVDDDGNAASTQPANVKTPFNNKSLNRNDSISNGAALTNSMNPETAAVQFNKAVEKILVLAKEVGEGNVWTRNSLEHMNYEDLISVGKQLSQKANGVTNK